MPNMWLKQRDPHRMSGCGGAVALQQSPGVLYYYIQYYEYSTCSTYSEYVLLLVITSATEMHSTP